MKTKVMNITITGVGVALFVVLSLCIQFPVFENYYLCLGYVAMTVFCYSVGTLSGTMVGTLGVILYCVLINGLRGMPGWALGNLVLGIIMGITFKLVKKINKPVIEIIISGIVVVIATAFAMLVVKSIVECGLYAQPFWLRATKNIYAFIADSFIIIFSIPIARIVEPKIRSIYSKIT